MNSLLPFLKNFSAAVFLSISPFFLMAQDDCTAPITGNFIIDNTPCQVRWDYIDMRMRYYYIDIEGWDNRSVVLLDLHNLSIFSDPHPKSNKTSYYIGDDILNTYHYYRNNDFLKKDLDFYTFVQTIYWPAWLDWFTHGEIAVTSYFETVVLKYLPTGSLYESNSRDNLNSCINQILEKNYWILAENYGEKIAKEMLPKISPSF